MICHMKYRGGGEVEESGAMLERQQHVVSVSTMGQDVLVRMEHVLNVSYPEGAYDR